MNPHYLFYSLYLKFQEMMNHSFDDTLSICKHEDQLTLTFQKNSRRTVLHPFLEHLWQSSDSSKRFGYQHDPYQILKVETDLLTTQSAYKQEDRLQEKIQKDIRKSCRTPRKLNLKTRRTHLQKATLSLKEFYVYHHSGFDERPP